MSIFGTAAGTSGLRVLAVVVGLIGARAALGAPGLPSRGPVSALPGAAQVAAGPAHEDSGEAAGDPAAPFEDPFASPRDPSAPPPLEDPFGIGATDWDSVFAAVDRDFERAQSGRFLPLVGLSYDKVAGAHLDLGVGLRPSFGRRVQGEVRGGYDFAREKPTGRALLRVGDLEDQRAWLQVGVRSGIRGYGSHRPYGNTLFALLAGYDAVGYLLERSGEVRLHWKPSRELRLQAAFLRAGQEPAPLREDFHLFGPDRWMETLPPVERWQGNAWSVSAEHRPRYSEEVVLPGVYAGAGVEVWGGGLGGERDFSRWEFRLKRLWQPGGRDELTLRGDFGVTAAGAPVQARQDIGGEGGLRAFEPRSFVGTQRIYARAEYMWGENVLRKSGLPLVHRLKVRLVPFAEVGSVWGRRALHRPEELALPDAGEWHWDLGFGLRRIVDTSGLLSFVQVNLAWPMGADAGPVRITASLSSRGFD